MSLWKPWYVFRPLAVIRSLIARIRWGRRQATARMRTAFGARLDVDPSDAIGAALLRNEVYEIAVSELLARAAARSETNVVDAGANIGYMALLLASFSPPHVRVAAFEPHPDLFRMLLRNIELNGLSTKIDARCCALSERQGRATMSLPRGFENNSGLGSLEANGGRQIEVSVDTLDDIFRDQEIDILKIDVEGHELGVLAGARDLLAKRAIHVVIFEAHEPQFQKIEEFLIERGMAVYAIDHDLWGPKLRAPNTRRATGHQSPNYLAILPEVGDSFREALPGWRCLRRP